MRRMEMLSSKRSGETANTNPRQAMVPLGYRSTDRLSISSLTKPDRSAEDALPPWAVRVVVVLVAVVIAVMLLSSCSGCQRSSRQSVAASPLIPGCEEQRWSVAQSGPSLSLRQTTVGGAASPITLIFEGDGDDKPFKLALPHRALLRDEPPPATARLQGEQVCLSLGVEDVATDPCLHAVRGQTVCFTLTDAL
jgi:hypothetical protein